MNIVKLAVSLCAPGEASICQIFWVHREERARITELRQHNESLRKEVDCWYKPWKDEVKSVRSL